MPKTFSREVEAHLSPFRRSQVLIHPSYSRFLQFSVLKSNHLAIGYRFVHEEVTMFKVGEKVVYPAHGVGEIEAIRTHVISGTERKILHVADLRN